MKLLSLWEITNLIMLITNYNHVTNLVVILNLVDNYKVRAIYTNKNNVQLVLLVVITLMLFYTMHFKTYFIV